MSYSKTLRIFRTFSPDEWKDFGKFLASPFHNSNKRILALYYLLNRYYPEFDNPKLEREALFYKLFDEGRAFDSKIMSALTSGLQKITHEFLVIQLIRDDDFFKKKSYINYFKMVYI